MRFELEPAMKFRKKLHFTFILVLISCSPSQIQQQQVIGTVGSSITPTSVPTSEISPTSPMQLETFTTASPRVIDRINVERLVLLKEWSIESLSNSYHGGNLWFSESKQFLVPIVAPPPTGGLQSFVLNDSTSLWLISSPHSGFTVSEQDNVILKLEGLKLFNKQGVEIQSIRTNEGCDGYSPLSTYIVSIPETSLVVTGQQDSYRDFGLYGENTDRARVLIWDISNNLCSDLIEQFDGIITSLSASYDGRYISYVVMLQTPESRIRTTRIFDLVLNKEKCKLAGGLEVHFNQQGKLIVYDVTDSSFLLVTPDDCVVEKRFNVEAEIINAFALSPNGMLMVGVTDFAIHFWDLETGEKLREIGSEEPILSIICFSPDGRFLVTAKRVDELLKKDQILLLGILEE